jgi:hypothetical protein
LKQVGLNGQRTLLAVDADSQQVRVYVGIMIGL